MVIRDLEQRKRVIIINNHITIRPESVNSIFLVEDSNFRNYGWIELNVSGQIITVDRMDYESAEKLYNRLNTVIFGDRDIMVVE
jgi:hypothetical protein